MEGTIHLLEEIETYPEVVVPGGLFCFKGKKEVENKAIETTKPITEFKISARNPEEGTYITHIAIQYLTNVIRIRVNYFHMEKSIVN